MDAETFTPATVRQWLEHSPAEPGPMAANLRGFIINQNFFCIRCCSRLSGRGILLPQQSVPVWKDRKPEFAACAACGTAEQYALLPVNVDADHEKHQ
jgi:hypothetical protein